MAEWMRAVLASEDDDVQVARNLVAFFDTGADKVVEALMSEVVLQRFVRFFPREDRRQSVETFADKLQHFFTQLPRLDEPLAVAVLQYVPAFMAIFNNSLNRMAESNTVLALLQSICAHLTVFEGEGREETFSMPSVHSPSVYHEPLAKPAVRIAPKQLAVVNTSCAHLTDPSVPTKWPNIRAYLIKIVDRYLSRFSPSGLECYCIMLQSLLAQDGSSPRPMLDSASLASLAVGAQLCAYRGFTVPALASLRLLHARSAQVLAPAATLISRVCLESVEGAASHGAADSLSPFADLPSLVPATVVIDPATLSILHPSLNSSFRSSSTPSSSARINGHASPTSPIASPPSTSSAAAAAAIPSLPTSPSASSIPATKTNGVSALPTTTTTTTTTTATTTAAATTAAAPASVSRSSTTSSDINHFVSQPRDSSLHKLPTLPVPNIFVTQPSPSGNGRGGDSVETSSVELDVLAQESDV